MSLVSDAARAIDRQAPRVASDLAKKVGDLSAADVARGGAPLGRDMMALTDRSAVGTSVAKDQAADLASRLLALQSGRGMRGQITYDGISMVKQATGVPLGRRLAFLKAVPWVTTGQFNAAAVDMILTSGDSTADKLAALTTASGMSRFMTNGQFDWARSQILAGGQPKGLLNFVFTHAIP